MIKVTDIAYGFCPWCGGRRMTGRASHLVAHVFPLGVPVRQWVLSVPHRLRYRLASDSPTLSRGSSACGFAYCAPPIADKSENRALMAARRES